MKRGTLKNLALKVTSNRLDRMHCMKQSAVCVVLVSPGSVETLIK